jgi:hypothetical protein
MPRLSSLAGGGPGGGGGGVGGAKALDFSDFKRVAELMENKAHLTEQGLSQIRSIKSKMNHLRDFD